ncbi:MULTISPECIES: type II secretion system secretin GspD [Citrobacter]|uniref:Type II secretion system secretin GspD n=1 Tax=Citrobacter cronae TaxID=1748967 RepID=A0A7X1BTY5_9ENTR|nr:MULTISPECIES: type II secretion system secretin GspD [Citrobacter]HCL4434637.1 type II secretion system secretin GspD [Salmonella enterica]MBC2623046.1 type II secretion system secretin GspD [Citrobacter cronae]MBJ8416762.1 type II secretion system secretin GspD [Citrobacter cronae]MBU5388846.1 type II secretion system secretin GspD [Citrobacter cronae]MDM3298431.1 type II secretion system secretin GspD [Citrobacter sp. Cc227]
MERTVLHRRLKSWSLILLLAASCRTAFAVDYTANFDNADIQTFVNIVGQNMGKTILIDPDVKASISVRSNDTFNEDEYYQFFLSVLDLYGFSIITLDNGLLKVVRSEQVKTMPGRLISGTKPGKGDELVTRIVSLENVPARVLSPLLRQMLDGGKVGNVVHYEPSNALIITGKASTVNRLLEVVKRVDVMGDAKEQVFTLKYASATDLADVLNDLARENGKEAKPATLQTRIVADKRSNALIVSGSDRARARMAQLISRLDTQDQGEGNTRVWYLKYAKADKLVEVLTGVTQKMKDEKSSASKSSASSSNNDISITADEQTNSLVITADQSILQQLEDVIAKLDIRRAQVLVEAIIVEVQDGKGINLGVQWANKNVGVQQFTKTNLPIFNAAQGVQEFKRQGGTTSDNPAYDLFSNFNGLAAGFFNGDWGVLLTALSSNSKNDILSTPSIVTLDNKEASFNAGQDVPVLSGSQTTSGDNIYSTVERKTVGTKLKVTPQINEGDSVLMEIEQEVSSVDSTATSSTLGPTFNTRTIQNAVLVKSGETVVLGGLMDDSSKQEVSKVPLLGDIPLIGQLFRYTSNEKNKRNLMVFIRPTIIRDDEVYHSLSRDKYTGFKEMQQNRSSKQNGSLIDVDAIESLDDHAFDSSVATPATSNSKNPFHNGSAK